MTRAVRWSADALADMMEQAEYLAQFDIDYADRVELRLREAGEALGSRDTGRPGRVAGTREKSLRGLPYVIAYRVEAVQPTITILRIIHTARDWPAGSWPGRA